jgi:AAA15 family ATPase/GTPase
MIIKKVEIENFRHLNNLNFNLGKHITVIAGGNGTGKTSILGLIGHIFKYGITYQTIVKQRFETKFSEVFRFSPNTEVNKVYKYKIIFENGISKSAESRTITENNSTRFRIDVGGRVQGGGKIKHPVIYLSLRRLLPLAQEDENRIIIGSIDELSVDYKDLYKTYYNQIFSTNEEIVPEHTKSYYKNSYSPTCSQYDSHGISAGQDNIGQIILALLSFKKLKETVSDYEGGVLLIDEIDSTLYPAAQKNLLKLLLIKARELDLQVIFTTHSSDLLNFLASQNGSIFKHDSNFVSLSNSLGSVKVKEGFAELSSLLADLNHEALRAIKPKRINVYFEDNEARIFYKNLISDLQFDCEIVLKNLSLSCGTYKTLLEKGFEEFTKSIVVLDGDFRTNFPMHLSDNVIFLPNNYRPENVVKDFLNSLPETDSFWDNTSKYTKRVFNQNIDGVNDNREDMKRWFNSQIDYWGVDGENLFHRWKELNQSDLNQITSRTTSIVNRILDNYYELTTN